MNGEYMSLETAKKTRRYNILLKRIRLLKKENERLRSIIKKVREMIENKTINCDGVAEDLIDDIYEILDKESKNE